VVVSGRGDLPSTAELGIDAELWNALARRVTNRTERQALFSVRDKAVRIAVMALDAATDEWLAGYEARRAAAPDVPRFDLPGTGRFA
jgi:hypothetical protein